MYARMEKKQYFCTVKKYASIKVLLQAIKIE